MNRMMRVSIPMVLVLFSSGCSTIMHELQPHRMWRMNYQEPSGRTDGVYFSIDDPLQPVPVAVPQTDNQPN